MKFHLQGLPYDLDRLLAVAPDAMLVTDQQGHIVEVNQRCAKLVGYQVEELLGQPVKMLMAVDQRERHQACHAHYLANPKPRDMATGSLNQTAVRKDGTEIPVEVSLTPFDADEGPHVIASLRDASRALRDERLFRMLLEATPDAVVIGDANGDIVLVNALAEDLLGYDRSELIGQSFAVIVPERLQATYLAVLVEYASHSHPVAGRPVMSELLTARRKDGSEVPVDVTAATLDTDEGTLLRADLRDITGRLELEAENQKAQRDLQIQAEIGRSKDIFIANLSHELRTPLTSMIGYLELIADSGELGDQTSEFLSAISRNTDRELRLVEDLLAVFTLRHSEIEINSHLVDLVPIVRTGGAGTSARATQVGLSLDITVPEEPLWVNGDAERLGQVLDILLANAVKFTLPGGHVALRLVRFGMTAHIEVADTGVGIGETPEHIFEYLYRSRTAIENEIPGTGIGLSIAEAITAAHGGTIQVLDTSEAGTTIMVELPLAPLGTADPVS